MLHGCGNACTELTCPHPAAAYGAFGAVEEVLSEVAFETRDLGCQDGLGGARSSGGLAERRIGQHGRETLESLPVEGAGESGPEGSVKRLGFADGAADRGTGARAGTHGWRVETAG